jgi:fatty-acid desaturase
MNHSLLLKIFHVLNHALLLLGVWILFSTGNYQYLWITLIIFAFAKIVGVNVGLHRYYSHRSFKTSKFFQYFIAFWSVIATVGSPFVYPSIHRYHHRHSDKDEDPHTPIKGKVKAFIGIWNVENIPWRTIIKDLVIIPHLRFVHEKYFLILITYIGMLLIIDPLLIIFAYALPACLCFWGSSSVNVLGHTWGYRNFDTGDNSRNNIVSSILSLGEGWHNNHHYSPYKWNTRIKWWEFDPPALIIKLIRYD